MPLVELTRDAKVVSDEAVTSLVRVLRPVVAEALRTPQTPITERDVDIRVRTHGRFEVTDFDLQVLVSASFTEERHRDLAERHDRIVAAVRARGGLSTGVRVYVWLTLPPAKFGEFIA